MPRMMPSSTAFSSPTGLQSMPFGEASPGFTNGASFDDGPSKRPLSSSSVKLSCTSPDGRSVHSLSLSGSGSCFIETHALPLVGTIELEKNENEVLHQHGRPSIIRTRLPERVATALQRYPAKELLCVDVDSPAASIHPRSPGNMSSPPVGRGKQESIRMPLLCLYTKKDVFILEVSYEATPGAVEVEGTLVSLQEPYEQFLMDSDDACCIVRIRQAPQKFKGHATLCPPGAMAMLTADRHQNECSLCLYHGKAGSTPGSVKLTVHYFGVEALDEPSERITDFCFCQSTGLPLLSSLTVVFLKGSGNVLFATPFLFQGTIVPSVTVTKTLEFLDSSLKEAAPKTAKWRQLKTAKQFLVDAFPDNGRSNFVTVATTTQSAALEWPILLQGPLFVTPDSDDDYQRLMAATTIEPFGSAGELAGFSIGYHGDMVDFCVASPSVFVPRFALESEEDTYDLDQDLAVGVTLSRVDLSNGDESTTNGEMPLSYDGSTRGTRDIQIIPDPIMDTVVHYVSSSGVVSISTNVARLATNQARESSVNRSLSSQGGGAVFSPPSKRSDLHPKTTAWMCLNVAFFDGIQDPLVGAVVSGDVQLGHVLVSRLASGQLVAINLTETRYSCEMESLAVDSSSALLEFEAGDLSYTERQLTQSLRDMKPLSDILHPLLRNVYQGISKMAQVGGSSTSLGEMTPNILAGAVAIQNQCEKEVLLPLVEMNEYVSARRSELATMYQNQIQQLKLLQAMISKLRERSASIEQKSEVVKFNAQSLARRSASVLQSTTYFLPTISEAEYSYFQQLKRIDSKSREWENEVERLKIKVSTLCDMYENGATAGPLDISNEELINFKTVLRASGKLIQEHSSKLDSAEGRIHDVARAVGFVSDPEEPFLSIQ